LPVNVHVVNVFLGHFPLLNVFTGLKNLHEIVWLQVMRNLANSENNKKKIKFSVNPFPKENYSSYFGVWLLPLSK
jgi:hypothetical protein